MKKVLKIIGFTIFFMAFMVALVWAHIAEKNKSIVAPNIFLHVDGGDAFLNEKELNERLLNKRLYSIGMLVKSLEIGKIEKAIANMPEVKNVRVFKFIGGKWNIDVELRKPIARIFLNNNKSYYLDSDGFTIPRSNLHTARVLIVSGDINEPFDQENAKEIINNDSLKSIRKIDDIYRMSNYICSHPVLRSLVGQIYIEKNGDFSLIPIVGEQIITFGSAVSDAQVKDKFERLMTFYNEGIPYEGWNKYSEITLKYDGQIVCRKRKTE